MCISGATGPQQKILQHLNNDLMIMLLLQPTNNNNPNDSINPLNPNREPTPMDSIIIRRRPPIRAPQRKLPHKRPLHLGRTATRQHLTPHQPARHAPAQDGIPLAPYPDLVIDNGAGLRGTLEDDVRVRGGAGHQRDGDQSGFALVGGQGEDASAEGEAERPGSC